MKDTPIDEIKTIHGDLYRSFKTRKTFGVKSRLDSLFACYRLLEENKDALVDALMADGKCRAEALMGDVLGTQKEVGGLISNLQQWVADEPVSLDLAMRLTMDQAWIRKDPLGVILVIGTWNYPLNTALVPVLGALAAGNCVCLKLSEVSVNTGSLLADLIPKYLDKDIVRVVTGAVPQATALLKLKWDHIFYTGNGMVGRVVARAAAEHLTPCTLELGGKSPVFVDKTVDLKQVAKRIMLAKCFNNGQTCIAPDYFLCPKEMEGPFVEAMREALEGMYGGKDWEKTMEENKNYGRIVSDRHFERLSTFLNKTNGKVVIGGQRNPKTRFFAPTVVTGVGRDDPLMKEEIFGPILPIIACDSLQEAVDFVNEGEKPLAAYLFTTDAQQVAYFKKYLLCGDMVINDLLMHFAVSELPFGGVGESGYGAYHGRHSLTTFSHQKSVLWRSLCKFVEIATTLRLPPYEDWKLDAIATALIKKPAHYSTWWFPPADE